MKEKIKEGWAVWWRLWVALPLIFACVLLDLLGTILYEIVKMIEVFLEKKVKRPNPLT